MPGGVDVPRDDRVADGEARAPGRVTSRGPGPPRARRRAALRDEPLERGEPPPVVAGGQVVDGREPLDRMAKRVGVREPGRDRESREREDATLPGGVEDGLVALDHD